MSPRRRQMTEMKETPSPEEQRLAQKPILTPRDVSAILGCGRTKTYELLRMGTIESFLIGRLRRVRREALERFIENHKA
jgi:excisionase family DNA binding protein